MPSEVQRGGGPSTRADRQTASGRGRAGRMGPTTLKPTVHPHDPALRHQLTRHGHVVLHLEERLVAALAQRGQRRGVTGRVQRDPVHAQQSVAGLQGALPGEEAWSVTTRGRWRSMEGAGQGVPEQGTVPRTAGWGGHAGMICSGGMKLSRKGDFGARTGTGPHGVTANVLPAPGPGVTLTRCPAGVAAVRGSPHPSPQVSAPTGGQGYSGRVKNNLAQAPLQDGFRFLTSPCQDSLKMARNLPPGRRGVGTGHSSPSGQGRGAQS